MKRYCVSTLYDGTIGGKHTDVTFTVDKGVIIDLNDVAQGMDSEDSAGLVQAGELGSSTDLEGSSGEQAAEKLDGIVVPGYIDIHHHGAGGSAYDDGVEAIATIKDRHVHHGTTRAVMSFVTAGMDPLEEELHAAAAAVREEPWLLGIHPEGPFLAPEHKGAHQEDLLIAPTRDVVTRMIEAGEGQIRQVTVAPELENGIGAIEQFVSAGIAAAVGHTNCDYETAKRAFDAGATILTHTFNAMESIHHRKPGPIIAAFRNPTVWLEVINDTVHVHSDVVRSIFVEAPERTVLVTDSMAATDQEDGDYMLGNLPVVVKDSIARVKANGSLAGSTLTMDRALANAVLVEHVAVDVAVAAATSHPAAAIGLGDSFGQIKTGYPADFLVLDPKTYLPRRIFCAGEEIL